jgi:2-(1,2-epoxy-1,2-dihydrophenyl)acetyl-CoA isomerase
MNYRTIKYAESKNVGTITLNRPEKRNAINETMVEELANCISYCGEDANTRAIILTGNGKAFCSGGDVLEISPSQAKTFLNILHPALLEIRRLSKPVIAAVNGPAIGGGFALALTCDIIIASKSARFNAHYVLIGVSPDCGMSYILPRLVGDKRATWLMFTGEMVDAQKGYEMGFVNQVVQDDQLLNEANALARKLAESATSAIARIKELIDQTWNESLETQMEYEKQLFGRLALMEDHHEAITAFREKRKAKFKGR